VGLSVISAVFDQSQTYKHSVNCPPNMIQIINRNVWKIWEGFVTKLVHRAYSGVRPSAINTPTRTRMASCALICEALDAIVSGLGRETPLT